MDTYAELRTIRDAARARYEAAKAAEQRAYAELVDASNAAAAAFDREHLPSAAFLPACDHQRAALALMSKP